MPNAEMYRRRKDRGLCQNCHRKVLKGYVLCAFHHHKNLMDHRRYYQRHHEKMLVKRASEMLRISTEHRCSACFNPMHPDMEGYRCPDCQDLHAIAG